MGCVSHRLWPHLPGGAVWHTEPHRFARLPWLVGRRVGTRGSGWLSAPAETVGCGWEGKRAGHARVQAKRGPHLCRCPVPKHVLPSRIGTVMELARLDVSLVCDGHGEIGPGAASGEVSGFALQGEMAVQSGGWKRLAPGISPTSSCLWGPLCIFGAVCGGFCPARALVPVRLPPLPPSPSPPLGPGLALRHSPAAAAASVGYFGAISVSYCCAGRQRRAARRRGLWPGIWPRAATTSAMVGFGASFLALESCASKFDFCCPGGDTSARRGTRSACAVCSSAASAMLSSQSNAVTALQRL